VKKQNSNRILHDRNIYVFLASVAEEAIKNTFIPISELCGFFLVKKLILLIDALSLQLAQKKNVNNLEFWDAFVASKDFQDVQRYIEKEKGVFKIYFQVMFERISSSINAQNLKLDDDVKQQLLSNASKPLDKPFNKVLTAYLQRLLEHLNGQAGQLQNPELKAMWTHADRIIDCL